MKRLFIFSLLFICSLFSYAQEWKTEYIEGDELKGTIDHCIHYFENSKGDYLCYDRAKMTCYIVCEQEDVYDYKSEYYDWLEDYWRTVDMTVGLYDSSNKLIKRMETVMRINERQESVAFFHGNPETHAMMKYLTEGEGFVRVLLPLYKGGEVDIKMPCHNSRYIQEHSSN